jgi:carbon starvation protein CstA
MLILFIIGILILVLGYIFYSPFAHKQFKLDDDMLTPAHLINDGVDFIPLGKNKNMLIQLLNIAGTGPIFGPIMAALFGPIVLILIPVGNVFAGALMDFGFGTLSLKNGGVNLPSLSKKYLGSWSLPVITIFTSLLLILVATVFVVTPANLLASSFDAHEHIGIFISLIFIYYILATILPIDKIVAPIYPFIAIFLIIGTFLTFMGISIHLFNGNLVAPSIHSASMLTWHPAGSPLAPGFIIATSCALISGFHTTQTPIVTKTLNSSKDARKTFYGMMTAEGVIGMIWAFASLVLFESTDLLMMIGEGTQVLVVEYIAVASLGVFAPIVIAVVVLLPITSGDTAFRSLRNVIAEVFKINQSTASSRVILALPIFGVSMFLMTMGFDTLWSYFTWANHMVSVITLLLLTAYLKNIKSNYLITLIPLIILFFLTNLYILTDTSVGFGIAMPAGYILSIAITSIGTYFLLRYSVAFSNEDIN